MLIVLHHAWLTIWPLGNDARAAVAGIDVTGAFAFGHFRVTVFIVLSGFCLTLPVARSGELRGGARRFFARRARRILPAYYAAVALSLLLIATAIGAETGSHWDASVPVSPNGVLANLLLVQNFVAQGEINHVLWSLAVECQLYLAFPLLLIVWSRFGVRALAGVSAACVVGIAAVSNVAPNGGGLLLDSLTPQFMTLFAVGMLGAILCASPAPGTRALAARVPWRLVLAGSGALATAGMFAARDLVLANLFVFDLVVAVAATSLLVATCTGRAPRLRAALASRSLVVLGTFAFSTYLVHAPLVQLVWQYAIDPFALSPRAAFAALLAVAIPFVLATSYAFFLVFERPFLSPHRRRVLAPALQAGSPSVGGGPARAEA